MKNILCYNMAKSGSVFGENMSSLIAGFREQGVDVIVCDISEAASVEAAWELLQHPEWIWFSVGFNGWGLVGQRQNEDGSASRFFPYADCEIPHVSVMLDVPYNFNTYGFDFPCRKHLVTLLDQSGEQYLDLAYPDANIEKMFMPLGGSIYKGGQELDGNRSYDVVFSASRWVDGQITRSWHDGAVSHNLVSLLDEIADYMENYPVTTVDAFQTVLQAHGLYAEKYREKLLPYYGRVLQYIKMQRRYRALEMLAKNDIRVDVFGANWESVPFADKLILHGEVPYAETLRVFSQAKIVFQDQAEFNHGAHDRVFTAMLNGAVVVSEYSSYLAQEFIDGEEIFLYDWQNGEKQIQVIHKLLADTDWRLSIANRAQDIARQRHCWRNRALDIMRAVTILYGDEQS